MAFSIHIQCNMRFAYLIDPWLSLAEAAAARLGSATMGRSLACWSKPGQEMRAYASGAGIADSSNGLPFNNRSRMKTSPRETAYAQGSQRHRDLGRVTTEVGIPPARMRYAGTAGTLPTHGRASKHNLARWNEVSLAWREDARV